MNADNMFEVLNQMTSTSTPHSEVFAAQSSKFMVNNTLANVFIFLTTENAERRMDNAEIHKKN